MTKILITETQLKNILKNTILEQDSEKKCQVGQYYNDLDKKQSKEDSESNKEAERIDKENQKNLNRINKEEYNNFINYRKTWNTYDIPKNEANANYQKFATDYPNIINDNDNNFKSHQKYAMIFHAFDLINRYPTIKDRIIGSYNKIMNTNTTSISVNDLYEYIKKIGGWNKFALWVLNR
jgi:hypothetical protein